MTSWQLALKASAQRDLARLPEAVATAAVELMIGPLLDVPERLGKRLEGQLEGYRSARLGPYRIVYGLEVETGTVRVVRIAHRADVYRRRLGVAA